MTNITKTVRLTVTREHSPHLLAPFAVSVGGREAEAPSNERYSIRVPAFQDFPGCRIRDKDDGLGPMTVAVGQKMPVFVIGESENPLDRDYWDALVGRAMNWSYPVNKLLYGREITVAMRMVVVTNRIAKDLPVPYLVAVRVEGDQDSFRKDERLEAHIKEIRSMLG